MLIFGTRKKLKIQMHNNKILNDMKKNFKSDHPLFKIFVIAFFGSLLFSTFFPLLVLA